jgi:hypothetical protein
MTTPFSGRRPDITPAQIAAVLVAGVPVIATLLSAFGVADMSRVQQDALTAALTWCGVLAGLLVGGDAMLRSARNHADARRDVAAMTAGAARLAPSGAGEDPEVDALEADLVVAGDPSPEGRESDDGPVAVPVPVPVGG